MIGFDLHSETKNSYSPSQREGQIRTGLAEYLGAVVNPEVQLDLRNGTLYQGQVSLLSLVANKIPSYEKDSSESVLAKEAINSRIPAERQFVEELENWARNSEIGDWCMRVSPTEFRNSWRMSSSTFIHFYRKTQNGLSLVSLNLPFIHAKGTDRILDPQTGVLKEPQYIQKPEEALAEFFFVLSELDPAFHQKYNLLKNNFSGDKTHTMLSMLFTSQNLGMPKNVTYFDLLRRFDFIRMRISRFPGVRFEFGKVVYEGESYKNTEEEHLILHSVLSGKEEEIRRLVAAIDSRNLSNAQREMVRLFNPSLRDFHRKMYGGLHPGMFGANMKDIDDMKLIQRSTGCGGVGGGSDKEALEAKRAEYRAKYGDNCHPCPRCLSPVFYPGNWCSRCSYVVPIIC